LEKPAVEGHPAVRDVHVGSDYTRAFRGRKRPRSRATGHAGGGI